MKFLISRETLLKPLNLVAGVVERRQTLPILSNVMLVLEGNQLSITGTDLEVELVGRVELEKAPEAGGGPRNRGVGPKIGTGNYASGRLPGSAPG